jgi:NAD+ synthase
MSKAPECINWIKDYFKDNPDGKAIIGISGGKDSTIAVALCVEALGADRVVGVMMPQGTQNDIDDAKEVCETLNIIPLLINIGHTCTVLMDWIAGSLTFAPHNKEYMPDAVTTVISNPMIKTNLPARIRMTTLYAVAALYPNSRVVNTCNRSEDYVGYSTKYGDAAGDFSPLGNLTVREVLEIGDELGLPEHLVHKAPSDGMCGKTDEDNLGFTYEQLDDHILGTGVVDKEIVEKIERLHRATRHKYNPMPTFNPHREEPYFPYSLPTFELFDYSKQEKRGLRAKSNIMDECASEES